MADAILHAAGQAWPPFVLVAGLLLIGAVVEADGLFRALGTRIERLGGGPIRLLAVLLGVEAIVTALLNLDTAVVFLTPIILHAARQRRCDERPFLYGSLFMANGASLLLPGSNLTNLIVLAHEHISGAEFARSMFLPWLVVVVVTVGFLVVAYPLRDERATARGPLPPLRLRLGAVATGVATVLILVLRNPAIPVFLVESPRSQPAVCARDSTSPYYRPCSCSQWPSAHWRGCGTAPPNSSVMQAVPVTLRSELWPVWRSTTFPLPRCSRRRSRHIHWSCSSA